MSQLTASEYVKRVERSGLSWPLPDELTDTELERRLFHPTGGEARAVRTQPDWLAIHRELRRKDVTLSLLWEEHGAVHPDGYPLCSTICVTGGLKNSWLARIIRCFSALNHEWGTQGEGPPDCRRVWLVIGLTVAHRRAG